MHIRKIINLEFRIELIRFRTLIIHKIYNYNTLFTNLTTERQCRTEITARVKLKIST